MRIILPKMVSSAIKCSVIGIFCVSHLHLSMRQGATNLNTKHYPVNRIQFSRQIKFCNFPLKNRLLITHRIAIACLVVEPFAIEQF